MRQPKPSTAHVTPPKIPRKSQAPKPGRPFREVPRKSSLPRITAAAHQQLQKIAEHLRQTNRPHTLADAVEHALNLYHLFIFGDVSVTPVDYVQLVTPVNPVNEVTIQVQKHRHTRGPFSLSYVADQLTRDAAQQGLAHWRCISNQSNSWWRRSDGLEYTFHTSLSNWPQELRRLDHTHPIKP